MDTKLPYAPKGCVAWMRPNSHSWHRSPHRIGPSCKKALTDTATIGLEILKDRARNNEYR